MSAAEKKAALQMALDYAVMTYRENPSPANKRYHDYVARLYLEEATKAEIEELTGREF